MTVAQTILSQLGGNKFLAMTGAKNLTSRPDGLSLQLPSNLTKVNGLRITLTAMDDYIVEGFAIRGTKCTPAGFKQGIYVETLRETFESMTGLRTSL